MSVINKMLKDLEQRQEPEHNNGHEGTSATFVPTQDKKQTGLVIVLTSVIVFLLIAFAWFYINNKNSAEKNTSIIQPTASAPATPAALKLENQAPEQTPNTIELATDATELATNSNTPITQPQLTAEKKAVSTHEKVTEPEIAVEETKVVQEVEPIKQETSTTANVINKPEATKIPEETKNPVEDEVSALAISEPADNSPQVSVQKSTLPTNKPIPTFSIEKTSTVLTKEQRIEKLMAKAQKSFDQGYITEAITQLKEVLAADDSHIDARNLLAVAWYGRGENQMAVSILNDGLGRYPAVEKWRLTAAKMFFKQNNAAGAFSYLEADLTSASVEYHTMKGTLARQLQRFDKAESAYLMLTQLQPNIGNWWLGYAIALDSQNKSQLALQSYKMVIEKGGVSSASMNFAQQRIQELQG